MSTPTFKGENIDAAFLAGDPALLAHPLPRRAETSARCSGENLKWESAERRDDLYASIRYQCPTCPHAWRDNDADRADLVSGDRWVRHNENASAKDASWTWNAMLPEWNRWAEPGRRVSRRAGLQAGR